MHGRGVLDLRTGHSDTALSLATAAGFTVQFVSYITVNPQLSIDSAAPSAQALTATGYDRILRESTKVPENIDIEVLMIAAINGAAP
jgi:hypothetical protein